MAPEDFSVHSATMQKPTTQNDEASYSQDDGFSDNSMPVDDVAAMSDREFSVHEPKKRPPAVGDN